MTRTTSIRGRAAERAGSRRPLTWLAIVGALLLPVVIGGILVGALYNPAERLASVSAAIVNDDEPVELDGQTVPLGRQLTAGLVDGSDEVESNLAWTITNDEDAAEGLADGTYAAVVTIPSNFSAAATSTAPGSTPEQATIRVTTPPDSLVLDDAISTQVTRAAASLTGKTISETYLENVFLGFTALNDRLGTAASGAGDLSHGARSAADGATRLADGVGQLGAGADGLASGASQLGGGASRLSSGATQAATGVDALASGAGTLADSGRQLAAGAQTLAGSVPSAEDTQRLATGASSVAQGSRVVADGLAGTTPALQTLSDGCVGSGADAVYCAQLAAIVGTQQQFAPVAAATAPGAAQVSTGVSGLADGLPRLSAGVQQLSGGVTQLSGGLDQLATGAGAAATGVRQLSTGAGSLSTGAQRLSSGAAQLADGASSASTGASDLAGGAGQLADGSSSLAEGLAQAVEQVPSYTDAEASSLASVVADPVAAEGTGSSLFGATAVPLLATVALWFGGLGTFVALRAVTARAVTSRRPSALLAGRALLPAAIIGAVQGLLVAGVMQVAASYDAGPWSLFAAVSVLTGIAFAAVHQALVAVFRGAGRWIAALVGVLAVATGIVSTVPGVFRSVASLLPTAPAYQGAVDALTSGGNLGVSLVGLAVWTLLAFAATTLAVARRRTVPPAALLATSPA